MSQDSNKVKTLSELEIGTIDDCIALLASKEEGTTRDGKPYYRVQFRDKKRKATAMIWSDVPFFKLCETEWSTGQFFKLKCKYSETQYGPQIDIDRIFPLDKDDTSFDPSDFHEATRFNRDTMFGELLELVETKVETPTLKQLVLSILQTHREEILCYPAASRNHHAFLGGYIEHVLSMTCNALYFAEKYAAMYSDMQPPLSIELVVAGAILHDIGKLQELASTPEGATYTAKGQLIGHILLGRDMVRDAANQIENFDPEILLRLEHIIVSHQARPEWGSPIAPHTPEALLVHYADDVDAKFQMMATALTVTNTSDDEFTARDNALRRSIFRGLNQE